LTLGPAISTNTQVMKTAGKKSRYPSIMRRNAILAVEDRAGEALAAI
jgi:hypothetical protein